MTKENALALRFVHDTIGSITVRDYLKLLLRALWMEQESFDAKRPFGDGGWEYDIYNPLVKSGFISGDLCETGGCNFSGPEDGGTFNRQEARDYVRQLIDKL